MELRDTVFSESLAADAVDELQHVIRGVRILGADSRNGRSYSESAMAQAARLYEGTRLNFNHTDKRDAGKERPFEDWVGELRNVRFVPSEKAVFGDAHILASDPRTPKLYEAVRRFPRSFGLSHVAQGVEKRHGKNRVVESIEAVASVDIVTSPATNAGLFESTEDDETMARKTKPVTRTLREIVEATPETNPFRKCFIEMMDAGGVEPEMEVEAPLEASPDDAMKAAAISAITAKIADADETQIAAMLEALGMSDSISAILGGSSGSGSEAPAGDKPASTPAEESAAVLAKVNLIEAENLLLKSGRAATPAQVAAVAAVPADQRQALVDTWPVKFVESTGGHGNGNGKPRPDASPSARKTEQPSNRWKNRWMSEASK